MKDILINNDGNLKIENGDFAAGDSTLQNQAFILLANSGEFKENPMVGVGIDNYILDSDMSGCEYEARKQFASDGLKVKKLNFKDPDNLIIEAEYE
jgi:hypothetical protein